MKRKQEKKYVLSSLCSGGGYGGYICQDDEGDFYFGAREDALELTREEAIESTTKMQIPLLEPKAITRNRKKS